MRFPQAAPGLRIARYRHEIEPALLNVIEAGRYVLGPSVEAFERAFAAFLLAKHAVGVNSGTSALELALRAVGVGPDDEVITTSMTASATGMAILATGAVIRYADIDAGTRCITADAIAAAITAKTKAIVPVHLYGQPCDMQAIVRLARARGIKIVEDCAQAHGSRDDGVLVGTCGDAAAFSFYPTKNLGGIGDGGAVVTNDAKVAETVRAIRQYGWPQQDRSSSQFGTNSRLDEIQAAALLVLLPHLDHGNAERRTIADVYFEALAPAAAAGLLGLPPRESGATYHQFAIAVNDRERTMKRLASRGIGTAIHYATPLHRQSALSISPLPSLPVTDRLAQMTLSLPIQPEIVGSAAAEIADIIVQEVSR